MAEINFNNLYNQLSPMDRRFYDQQFQKSYDPNKENLRLSGQENYDQMKAVYDAQQQVPEESFLDKINIFGSASAAEMPQVPNLTYRNIDLPFDLRTGVTNTTAASPFLKSMADIDASGNVNTDLVNQLITENQMKASQNFIGSPFLNVPRGTETISPNTGIPGVVEPDGSFRVIPGYINRSNNIYMGDAASAKPNKIDLSSLPANMGVANEPDEEQVEYLTEQEPSGIAKLFEFLGKLPTPFNLARRGLESLRGLNDRIQGSDFGQSRTGAEYFMKRRERKQAERAQEAMPDVYRSAKDQGFTNDRGGFSTSRADRAGTSLGSGQFNSKRSTGRQGY